MLPIRQDRTAETKRETEEGGTKNTNLPATGESLLTIAQRCFHCFRTRAARQMMMFKFETKIKRNFRMVNKKS